MLAAKRDGTVYLALTPAEVDVLITALAYYLTQHRTPNAARQAQAQLLRRLSQTPSTKGAQ